MRRAQLPHAEVQTTQVYALGAHAYLASLDLNASHCSPLVAGEVFSAFVRAVRP